MRLYGLDGCRAGWVAASAMPGDLAAATVEFIPSIGALFAREMPLLVGVDMTIGLPVFIGPGGRAPERMVRAVLGVRRSTVFPTPCRAAVYARDYAEACALAVMHSDPPRKPSKQAFNVFPKMREIDALLGAAPRIRPLLREVHPETTYWALNGERPVLSNKASADGAAERRRLLAACGIGSAAIATRLGGAKADDVLDALAVLVTTARVHRGEARVFGEPGDLDPFGYACEISA